jgi:hypothetical protein
MKPCRLAWDLSIPLRTHNRSHMWAAPPRGFSLSCLAHKIHGASVGWARAVAILECSP